MSVEKYICPRCGESMHWTGNISQNPNENRWCSVLYEYKCNNIRCGHKTKYDNLDSYGMRAKKMIYSKLIKSEF